MRAGLTDRLIAYESVDPCEEIPPDLRANKTKLYVQHLIRINDSFTIAIAHSRRPQSKPAHSFTLYTMLMSHKRNISISRMHKFALCHCSTEFPARLSLAQRKIDG